MFGRWGLEGRKGLHDCVHFEPFKYIYGLIYKLTQSPTSISIFIAILYFLPLIYIVRFFPVKDITGYIFILAILLLYSFYPSIIYYVTIELRPFILFNSTVVLLALSFIMHRPFKESLIIYNFMFLMREEALILGIIAIVSYLILNFKDKKRLPKRLLWFGISWFFWALVIFIYYKSFELSQLKPMVSLSIVLAFLLQKPAVLVSLSIVLTAFGFIVLNRKLRKESAHVLAIMLFMIPYIYKIIGQSRGTTLTLKEVINSLLFDPMWTYIFIMMLVIWIMFFRILRNRKHKTIVAAFSMLIVVFCFALNIFSQRSIVKRFHLCLEEAEKTKIIFDLRKETDRMNTIILCDPITIPLFYDFENAYGFFSAPAFLADDKHRFFPNNSQFLTEMLKKTDYITAYKPQKKSELAARAKAMDIIEVLKDYGFYQKFDEYKSNEHYIIFKKLK